MYCIVERHFPTEAEKNFGFLPDHCVFYSFYALKPSALAASGPFGEWVWAEYGVARDVLGMHAKCVRVSGPPGKYSNPVDFPIQAL